MRVYHSIKPVPETTASRVNGKAKNLAHVKFMAELLEGCMTRTCRVNLAQRQGTVYSILTLCRDRMRPSKWKREC
ncbi:hypothetical protein M404DRAFT_991937 [Pisolithus tinctorius Marx 270]|uniref:Uncharacterized protein n=1 Tax=Pisolithus tinctorius Marx 270 TaxID=870435 RepID=A0A0C3Q056_PISTI|nr:hypothetical protein M404DRAFT_991937 [Pisolithus tinctorius Marx 270]